MEFDRGNPARRCTAHNRSGGRCRKWAILGGTTCGTHGGRAPQVKRKARQRLEEAADRMARELLKIATDGNVSEAVRVNAIKDALDRAGVSARTAVDVSVTAAPFETILEHIESGSRAEYRRSRGIEDDSDHPPALADSPRELPPVGADAPLDAEIVDEGAELIAAMRASSRVNGQGEPMTPTEAEHAPADSSAPGINPLDGKTLGGPLGPTGPAGGGMMTLEDAVAAQAEMRRAAVRRAETQRALPRGRSQ
jgi:hypothetical protein